MVGFGEGDREVGLLLCIEPPDPEASPASKKRISETSVTGTLSVGEAPPVGGLWDREVCGGWGEYG